MPLERTADGGAEIIVPLSPSPADIQGGYRGCDTDMS